MFKQARHPNKTERNTSTASGSFMYGGAHFWLNYAKNGADFLLNYAKKGLCKNYAKFLETGR